MTTYPYDSDKEQAPQAIRNLSVGQKERGSDLARQIMVIVALAITLFVNYLADALPINNRSTAEISDSFPVRFTPAGYVFSIWGLIYLGLLAYAIYQLLPSQRANPRLRAIFGPFVITCAANSSWIFAWHYGLYTLSLLIVLVLLGALIAIYGRLYPHFPQVSTAERWTTHVPFRIYLGWASVATIANAAVALYALGWQGAPLGADDWAAFMIFAASLIGFFFALRLRDMAYPLVLVWAFIGIYLEQSDAPTTAYTALTMAGVVAGATFLAWLFGQRRRNSVFDKG
ncbi:MAG: tryptophan-rich sensory protein [Caldilineaceae bacterium]|nr:tryptophan-rich sensory protein [Caldilineaceae bacterium]